jgi:hypothetical protein
MLAYHGAIGPGNGSCQPENMKLKYIVSDSGRKAQRFSDAQPRELGNKEEPRRDAVAGNFRLLI